jgi:hypothetical protein
LVGGGATDLNERITLESQGSGYQSGHREMMRPSVSPLCPQQSFELLMDFNLDHERFIT